MAVESSTAISPDDAMVEAPVSPDLPLSPPPRREAGRLISKRQRIEAAIRGERLDRAPVALWRHFPVDDQSPATLANSISRFQRTYDFDLVKVTPASSFCLKDWGIEDRWEGSSEGTRTYTRRVINTPDDWAKLPVLDPHKGHLAEQLTCLTLLRNETEESTPILQTIFNPLSQAKNLAGDDVLIAHLHQAPELVLQGLKTIVDTTLQFISALADVDIDGIFYAVQHASYRYFDQVSYARFGEAHDRLLLEAAGGWWLNILHLHGEGVMFDLAASYPVQVINWHDLQTAPTLLEGAEIFDQGAVCGGIGRRTLELGTPVDIMAEAEQALSATPSLILSTGCVVPITAPDGNIDCVRSAVDFA